MPRLTDAELGRKVRLALRGHRLKPRRLDGPSLVECYAGTGRPACNCYEECDRDFFESNRFAIVALLEALRPPRRRAACPKHGKE